MTASPAATLPSLGSTTCTITFAPTVTGVRLAALHIASNDPDENPFDVTLIGTGPTPDIAIEQPAGVNLVAGVSTVDFGMTLVGSGSPRTFFITNAGTHDLAGLAVTIDGTNTDEFVLTASPAVSVAAGGRTSFTVTFTPVALEARTAALHISSNDADEDPFHLTLSGAGMPPTPSGIAQQAYLKPSIPRGNGEFGYAVAISGDKVVVGWQYSQEAYIFVRNAQGWMQQACLQRTDERFGASVAIAGDTVVIGAPWEDSSSTGVNSSPDTSADRAGAVYVFVRNGTSWTQQAI